MLYILSYNVFNVPVNVNPSDRHAMHNAPVLDSDSGKFMKILMFGHVRLMCSPESSENKFHRTQEN